MKRRRDKSVEKYADGVYADLASTWLNEDSASIARADLSRVEPFVIAAIDQDRSFVEDALFRSQFDLTDPRMVFGFVLGLRVLRGHFLQFGVDPVIGCLRVAAAFRTFLLPDQPDDADDR